MTEWKKDTDWARQTLLRFRETVETHREVSYSFQLERASREAYYETLSQAVKLQPVAWSLITDLVPEAQPPKSLRYGSESEFIEYVDQALGVLDGYHELEEHWSSETQVALDSSRIHPWVWDPAKDLWEISRYKEALHSAALTVNARLQDKLGRSDLEFAKLARNAFSINEPSDGQPKLRLPVPADWGPDARKDIQEGAASLGEAIFRLWRNLPSHKAYTIEPQGATEALGAMSVFARMVDEAEVIHRTADAAPT